MTEKRFKLEVEDDMYYTIFDNQSTDEEDKLYGLDDEQICDLLNELAEENKKLKAQLYCPFDSICIQCNNEYLVQKGKYYVSKCKKEHEQCSKVDVKYCDDFELKGDLE